MNSPGHARRKATRSSSAVRWRKMDMSKMEKPEYLGTLNAISLAESEAGVYLEAWANATTNEELASCLRLVAARESSHGETFCRRIAELGFELQPKSDPQAAARLAKY